MVQRKFSDDSEKEATAEIDGERPVRKDCTASLLHEALHPVAGERAAHAKHTQQQYPQTISPFSVRPFAVKKTPGCGAAARSHQPVERVVKANSIALKLDA